MAKTGKNIIILILLILALIGGCSLLKKRSGGLELVESVVTVDTTYVNVKETSTIYVPVSTKEYVTLLDTIYIDNEVIIIEERALTHADTLEIVSDYYTKRDYSDTLVTEYGNVIVNDQLWKNRIYSRSYDYDFKFPEYSTTTTNKFVDKISKFKLYAGGSTALPFSSETNPNILEVIPSLYAGAGYNLKNGHSIYYERDFARKDNRFTYEYDLGRWEGFGTYSSQYNYMQFGIKFYLLGQ